MIEVILLERIERLGQLGQVVKVRPGFARNFLLPQKKALRATPANLDLFEKQRAQLEAHNAAERAKAEVVGKKLDGISLVIIRQASETGHLFGSVASRDIAEALVEAGYQVARSQVLLAAPLKVLGLSQVRVKLHPEVYATVTVNIARTQDEARVQAEKGAAVVKAEKAAVAAEAEAAAEGADAPAAEAAAEPKAKKTKAKAAAAEGTEEPKAKKPRAKKAAAAE